MVLVFLAPVVLAWTPKVGDKAVYKVVETATTMGVQVKLDGTLTETTTKVDAERIIQLRDSAVYAEMPGHPRALLPPRPAAVVYRPDGTVLDVEVANAAEDAFRFERLKELTLPKEPVAVGGTWTVELPDDPNASDTGLKTVYTLVGEEKVGTWDTWKIAVKGGEVGDSKATVEATLWIDKATGARIHIHSKVTGATFPGDEGRRVDMEEDILRQPGP